ncbi:hypothetical protein KCP73_21210 [Salmonella enterica subsp. enterica]|nr:hypothetical protein KCP73_21210 [Salmonella enterica subsp. enterica]
MRVTLAAPMSSALERWRRFWRLIRHVNGVSEFRARDVLLIDMSARRSTSESSRRATAGTDAGCVGEYFFRSGVGCRDGGNFAYSGVRTDWRRCVKSLSVHRYGLNVVGLNRRRRAGRGRWPMSRY